MTENKTIPGLPSEIKVKIIEELVQLTLDKFNSSFADIYFQESGSRIGTIADLKDIILSILVSINVNIIASRHSSFIVSKVCTVLQDSDSGQYVLDSEF